MWGIVCWDSFLYWAYGAELQVQVQVQVQIQVQVHVSHRLCSEKLSKTVSVAKPQHFNASWQYLMFFTKPLPPGIPLQPTAGQQCPCLWIRGIWGNGGSSLVRSDLSKDWLDFESLESAHLSRLRKNPLAHVWCWVHGDPTCWYGESTLGTLVCVQHVQEQEGMVVLTHNCFD